MQRKYICYKSFPHTLLKRNIYWYIFQSEVYRLSMSGLRCNFTICNFGKFKFYAKLFLRINLSSYFPSSYFSGILQISRIADLQHWIFLNFLDILLMLLKEGGVIFPFPE